jgi:hypothetical protein
MEIVDNDDAIDSRVGVRRIEVDKVKIEVGLTVVEGLHIVFLQ